MKKSLLVYGLLLGLCLAVPVKAADEGPVSRLPRVSPDTTDPILQKLFATARAHGAQPLNLQLTTGNAPKIAAATQGVAYALRFDAETPRPLRELTILRTAQIVGAPYEVAAHRPILLHCGYSEAQVKALPHWRRSKLFNDKERAMLSYVEAVAHGGNVDDATWNRFAKYFNPQEAVEETVLIGNYVGNGLLTKAFRIKIETDGRQPGGADCK